MTARSVAARSALSIWRFDARHVAIIGQDCAIRDVAIVDECAIERVRQLHPRVALDGVKEAHRLERAQRMARVQLQRHAVMRGVALHVEQIQALLRRRHRAR